MDEREEFFYKQDVVELIFRLALSLFREEEGNPEEIFEKHRNLILDLLKDKRVYSRDAAFGNREAELAWNDRRAERYVKDLTEYQKSILRTIINKEGATIEDLEDGIKDAKLPWKGSATIGGAMAGLTRKCRKRSIPSVWDYREGKYIISMQAKPFITKYPEESS